MHLKLYFDILWQNECLTRVEKYPQTVINLEQPGLWSAGCRTEEVEHRWSFAHWPDWTRHRLLSCAAVPLLWKAGSWTRAPLQRKLASMRPPLHCSSPSQPFRGLQEVMMLVSHQVFAIDRWKPQSTVITNHRSTGTLSSTWAIDLVTGFFLPHLGAQGRVDAVVLADIVCECG